MRESNIGRKYGWRPSLPDERWFRYAHQAFGLQEKAARIPLSARVHYMPPIEDQGQEGSCTANATVATIEHLDLKAKLPFVPRSRNFLYYNTRDREGTASTDSGATLADTMWALNHLGICNEESGEEPNWSYDPTQVLVKPPQGCYAAALKHRITSYFALSTLQDMLACIAADRPFVFGFTVYDSFESQDAAATGIINLPAAGESVLGGHAVCVVGYNQQKQRFLCRNSWGVDWGMPTFPGHFTIPFDYVTDSQLAGDYWTVKK